MKIFANRAVLLATILLCISGTGVALEKPGEELKEVGIDQKRGAWIDLDANFTTESGERKPLREILDPTKPAVLIPVYYGCMSLCGLALDGALDVFNQLTLILGEDYQIATVSFNVKDSPGLAKAASERIGKQFKDPALAQKNWRFLVGEESSVMPLMDSIGFKFRPDGNDFAHASTLVLLTPEGQISQYFTGVVYPAFDLKLALIEASDGKVGTALDRALLYCFRFDPTQGKYIWFAFNIMRAGGAVTLLLLGGLIYGLWRRERRGRLEAKVG